ncbi:MAG: 3-hydroxyacyl-CoA dehydrogenase NAD-binding domain-containing protein [Ghiorsea sp.]
MSSLIQRHDAPEDTTLVFHRQDKSVNVIDHAFLGELEAILDDLEQHPPQTLVLKSDFPHCFIAGADLDLIAQVQDEQAAIALAKRGQTVCRRIEMLPCLRIAIVQGSCMGGGLELALACSFIVAVEHPKTQLALPEIKIGIHPGFGGCVRLPKRVGWLKAIDMIMTGRSLKPKQAKRAGLAALSCFPENIDAAIAYLRQKNEPRYNNRPWWLSIPPIRRLFFHLAHKKAQARLRHLDLSSTYPAIPATLQLLEKIQRSSDGIAYTFEAQSLGKLAITPTCKNLIRVFFLGEALKNQDAVKKGRNLLKDSGIKTPKTAVFGAGMMGSGIAWVASKLGHVDLHDLTPQALGNGMKAAAKFAKRQPQRMHKIRPVQNKSGLHNTDIVIEAVLEDLSVKQALWKHIEAAAPEHTLLLSNTSSLSISAQQQGLNYPERLAGLHFFNPAPKMPLVEVIAGNQTSRETLHKTAALAANMGKYPIITADSAGFLVNRCLMPYMAAAIRLFEQGQSVENIDHALKRFGMPMGALDLADQVGLDICYHVGNHLHQAFGDRMQLPPWIKAMVDQGYLGKKSGKGFYRHQQQSALTVHPSVLQYQSTTQPALAEQAIIDACLLPMLVEALQCLHQEVVSSAEQLDAAMIYAIGFPPFHGGLMHYFAQRPQEILSQQIKDLSLEIPENIAILYPSS